MISKATAGLCAASALALSACGITGPAHTETPPPRVDETVTMGLTSFTPAQIEITAGQTVQWRNTSIVAHTVTADASLAARAENVELPEGAEPFHSGEIEAGDVWSHTFDVPGTYRYVCLPHELQGMLGTVVVQSR